MREADDDEATDSGLFLDGDRAGSGDADLLLRRSKDDGSSDENSGCL